MPYLEHRIDLGTQIEVEKTFSGRWGKRIPRGEKEKPTKEIMEKVNLRNTTKKLRRTLVLNFEPGDYHITLTYVGDPPEPKEAAGNLSKFLLYLQRWYRRQGKELRYVKVTEYKQKRIHHHIVVNDIPGVLGKMRALWKGGMYPSVLYADGGFEDLAAYLVKETKLTFRDLEAPSRLRYSTSRNLKKPQVETRVMKADEWVKTPVPPRGYWIPKESLEEGVSEITGRRYQYYTLIPMERAVKGGEYYKPRRQSCRSG